MELDNSKIKIKSKNLNVYYGNKQALHNINLEINNKEVTALIGPSGCGKSTFIRCINRMNDTIDICKVDGSIEIDGKEVNDKNVDVVTLREKIGMVFQKPNPFPKSIYDNIAYGPTIHGIGEKKDEMDKIVETSLKKAALWDEVKDRLGREATGLSLEEQQKLCIARLLPVKPTVILMDEPTSALDPKATEALEELIWELHGDYTILIVTHNMAQAKRASEETAFMLLGRMVEHGVTEQIFLAPQEQETADYIEGRYG